MIRKFLSICAAVALATPAGAGVVFSCSGSVFVDYLAHTGTSGTTGVLSGPNCSAHGQGTVHGGDGRYNIIDPGTAIGSASADYSAGVQESGAGFAINSSVSAEGFITLTSFDLAQAFPEIFNDPVYAGGFNLGGYTGRYGNMRGVFLDEVSGTSTFSVDEPYTFQLDFTVLNGSLLGLSSNFFAGTGPDLYSFGPGSAGVLTGTLLPGQQYSLFESTGGAVDGTASNGETKTFTGDWGRATASLVAVQVPEPGTISIMLSGMLGLFAMGRRHRRRFRA